jgi:hypothetical protein
MPGPVTTLGSPLNVGGGGGVASSGGPGGISDDIGAVTDQARGQTAQFGGLIKDPNFTGQSEMSAMLRLQREVSLQQMMFQTLSNVMKANTDSSKNAIQNMR